MIDIKSHSGIYTLTTKQHLNMSIKEAWEFFSSPHNLKELTPRNLGFKITSDTYGKIYTGQIISYKVSPILGIKMNWVTEITHVNEHKLFVDEQRFGPYAMWHHEHHFEEKEDGVLMTDKITYKVPLGFLGRLVHPILVAPQLKQIFTYRAEILNEKFKGKRGMVKKMKAV